MARRSARQPVGFGWIVSWPLTVALAAIIFLSAQELRPGGAETPQPVGSGPGWEARLQERLESVTLALEQSTLEVGTPREESMGAGNLRWTHRIYEIVLREDDRSRAEAEIEMFRVLDPGLNIGSEATFNGTQVQMGLDGLLTHTLRFRWAGRPERPQVALVMMDLGDDLRLARRAVELDLPVALAIRSARPFSKEVAHLGAMFEREVLLQMDLPASGDPVAERMKIALGTVPSVVGVVGVGDDDDRQRELAEDVRGRGLFYVSDRTDAPWAPFAVVQLDNREGAEAMASQVSALLSVATRDGFAIGFGRCDDLTAQGLEALVAAREAGHIDVVPVSAMIQTTSLSAP